MNAATVSPKAPLPHDVVLFSTADWDCPFWTNKQHMARCFARFGYRVLYVDSLGLRLPTIGGRDLYRITKRFVKCFVPLSRVEHNIWRLSPIQIPLHGSSVAQGMNHTFLRLLVANSMRLIGFRKPILWTYTPTVHKLIPQIPLNLTVYHCVDDLRAAPGVDAGLIEQSERLLAGTADIAFTSSPRLQKRLEQVFPRCHYFPNVCDQALFSTARSGLDQPGDIAGIPFPRAIFIGALSAYKVDFTLLRQVALACPDLHFLLIGQQGEGQPGSRFEASGLPNVHLLGPKPYVELPSYLAHANVAILPAALNAYTSSMFPMKFFEYLSAGKQVVATDLPALQEYADICFLANDRREFVGLVNQVVFGGLARDPGRIDAVCREQTWEKRFARMEEVFLPLLHGRI